jgi:cell wall-associated NlpC family hydrolase
MLNAGRRRKVMKIAISTTREVSAQSARGGQALAPKPRYAGFHLRVTWVRIALVASMVALVIFQARFLATTALAGPSASVQPGPQKAESESLQASQDALTMADDQDTAADDNGGTTDNADSASPEDGAAPPDDNSDASRVAPSSRGGARPAAPAQGLGDRIAAIAKKYLGTPYRWSGSSPSGFDCSGFTSFIYRQAGIPIPRDLGGQLNSGPSVSVDDLEPGDLVIFQNTYMRGLSHAGIYIGDGQFIDAQDEADGVVVNSLESSNWASHIAGASRPWQP